jgi:hypothetical protein
LGRGRGTILGFLEQIACPPAPARRHPRNRKQPFDFIAITSVDAKYISDSEIVIGSLDYPDLVSGRHITLDNYSEVRPWSGRLGEAARKRLIVHPNSEPPAGDSRLGNLKNKGADPPPLSDECIVRFNSFYREVFAKFTVSKRSADLLFPPPYVLGSVCVDRFIGSPVCLAIRLVIAGEVDTSGCDSPDGR